MDIKKLFALMFVFLFTVSLVSAFEFDNIKEYDKETKTAEIYNSWIIPKLIKGDKIADVTLNTKNHMLVEVGEDRLVAEFTIDMKKDEYINFFKDMKFYDRNVGMKEIEREFDYKVKIKSGVDLIPNCISDNIEGTPDDCDGMREVDVYDYVEFNEKKIKKGIITVGVFTDVYEGDYIEWIPEIAGIKIDEWADFEAYDILSNYMINDDDQGYVGQTRWYCQQFINNYSTHSLEGVSVKVLRVGTPANNGLNITLTSMASTGKPLFDNLSVGGVANSEVEVGASWINFTMTPYTLLEDANLSICLWNDAGGFDTGNTFLRRIDSTSSEYNSGSVLSSSDTGST